MMKISFTVNQLPPKKDGANSMWRKGSELARLKALRTAAFEAMQAYSIIEGNISLTFKLFADPAKGDLDNFITGICDGLMAAHKQTPVDMTRWNDVPEPLRPDRAICFRDDAQIQRITAERIAPGGEGERYFVELEW